MNWELVWVLVLLVSAIAMFAVGKPRMDVVAVLMIVALPLTGVLTVPETLAGFADPNVVLIVGMLPFAQALEQTGGVDLIVDGLLGAVGGAGPTMILAAIFVMTAVIGLFVSNTATAVLMAPIAITTAQQLDASPYPFAMMVALAASSAFMTPVSSPVNTLVVEPGRYRFFDFVRIGAPFTVVVLVVSVLLVPLVLPL